MIETGPDGKGTGVMISQPLKDCLDLPQKLWNVHFPAFIKFSVWCRHMHCGSGAKKCDVFDNRCFIRSGQSYVFETDSRHLRGCDMDREALRSPCRRASEGIGPVDDQKQPAHA
jgi:hypothetical protein